MYVLNKDAFKQMLPLKTIFELDYLFFQSRQVSGTKSVLEIWLWNLANQLFLSVRLMATQDPVLGGNEKMIGHFQEQKLVIILEIFLFKFPFFLWKGRGEWTKYYVLFLIGWLYRFAKIRS